MNIFRSRIFTKCHNQWCVVESKSAVELDADVVIYR